MTSTEEQDYKKQLEKLEKQVYLLKNHLQNLEVAVSEISSPMGVVKVHKDREPNYELIYANPAFFNLSKIETFSLPLSLHEAFSFLKNLKISSIEQFVDNRKLDKIVFALDHEEKRLKLKIHKTSPGQLSFTFEDVTDFKTQRNELAKTSRQLKESQSIARLGHWTQSHIDTKHYWSREIYRILELDENTPASFNAFVQHIHPEDKDEVKSVYKESIANKTGYEITHRVVSSSGLIKTVNQKSYTEYNEYGEPIQTIGIVQDISSLEFARSLVQKSEEKFRSVFQNSPIAIILVDNELRPLTINPQFQRMVGYSYNEIAQMHLSDFTHPSDYDFNVDQYTKLFSGQTGSFTIVKRYLRKDQSIIWVKLTVSAIRNTENKVDMAVAMVQDITAEKQASEALIRSEHKYRTLIENATDGIGLFSMDGSPLIHNTALHTLLGYTSEEYFGFDHLNSELIHPDDQKAFQNLLPDLIEGKKVRLEKRIRNKEGEYIYCSFSFNPVVHENQQAYLLFMRDITARKTAELQNEEYRQFLETIMDNIPVSLFAKTTPDFRYLYWNHTLEKLTGISADDAIGSTDKEIMPIRSEADDYYNEDYDVLTKNKRIEKEHELTNSLGEKRTLHTIKVLHQSSIGKPLILGISVDITKMKEIETQIATSNQLLKEAQKIARLGYWEYHVGKDLFFDNSENRQIFNIQELPYFVNLEQFTDLAIAADQYQIQESIKQSIEKNVENELIVRIAFEDKIKHIALKFVPVANKSGEVTKLKGTSLDITRVRQSEIALRESETRLKQAEHIARVGYWNFDFESHKLEFSDEIYNIIETPASETKKSFKDYLPFLHQADIESILKLYLEAKNESKPFNHDFRIVSSTGKIKYLKAKGTFVRNQQGNVTRSIGTVQDISEIKEKEIALAKYSDQLREIQELTKTGFFEYNIEANNSVFSDTMFDIVDVDKKSTLLTNDYYNNLIHPEDKPDIMENISNLSNKGEGYNLSYRLLLDSGIKYINEIGHIHIDSEKLNPVLTRIIQDVTHIRQREITLLNAQSKLSRFEQLSLLGSWEYNTANNTYHFSERLKEFFGVQNEKVNFTDIIDLVHPDDKYSVKKILSKCYSNKEDFILTFRVIIPGSKNKIRFVNSIGSVIKNALNEWVVYGLMRDVSDFREAQQKQNESNEMFRAITDNNLFASVIFQGGKHIFANKKWKKLVGLEKHANLENLGIHEIYTKDTVRSIEENIKQLYEMQVDELDKTMELKPLNAPPFKAELFVKEIFIDREPALFVLMCIHKEGNE